MIDASTTQLAHTHKNQRRYPQPSSQKPGCGFLVLRFVALFSLASSLKSKCSIRRTQGRFFTIEYSLFYQLYRVRHEREVLAGKFSIAALPKGTSL